MGNIRDPRVFYLPEVGSNGWCLPLSHVSFKKTYCPSTFLPPGWRVVSLSGISKLFVSNRSYGTTHDPTVHSFRKETGLPRVEAIRSIRLLLLCHTNPNPASNTLGLESDQPLMKDLLYRLRPFNVNHPLNISYVFPGLHHFEL